VNCVSSVWNWGLAKSVHIIYHVLGFVCLFFHQDRGLGRALSTATGIIGMCSFYTNI